MRRPGKVSGLLGLIAVVIALIGLVVVQAEAQDRTKCDTCTGVTSVTLGF